MAKFTKIYLAVCQFPLLEAASVVELLELLVDELLELLVVDELIDVDVPEVEELFVVVVAVVAVVVVFKLMIWSMSRFCFAEKNSQK